jgi:hypothetical protein
LKNKTIVCMLAILMLPLAAQAQPGQINLVGTAGMATGNTERLIVNVGIEIEVFRHFYAQFSFDNFLAWDSLTGYYGRDGRIGITPTVRTQVFGVNLLATYKLALSRRLAWFAKAGLALTFHSRYYYDNYNYDGFGYYGYGGYDYYPRGNFQDNGGPTRTGPAYALGTGLEHRLSDKLALIGGATYESLFDQTPAVDESGARGDWVKLYIGFNYRLR